MSGKRRGYALPSILSNIRNAGRASTSSHHAGSSNIPRTGSSPEMRSLVLEYETSPTSESNNNPNSINCSKSNKMPKRPYNSHSNVNNTGISSRISRLMEKGPIMLERHRDNFRKNRRRMRIGNGRGGEQGFAVELPPRVLVYTIIIFFVLPLMSGCFFLIRTIFFGSLREDELHPLHKKVPRARVRHGDTNGNGVSSSSSSQIDNVDPIAAVDIPGQSGGEELGNILDPLNAATANDPQGSEEMNQESPVITGSGTGSAEQDSLQQQLIPDTVPVVTVGLSNVTMTVKNATLTTTNLPTGIVDQVITVNNTGVGQDTIGRESPASSASAIDATNVQTSTESNLN